MPRNTNNNNNCLLKWILNSASAISNGIPKQFVRTLINNPQSLLLFYADIPQDKVTQGQGKRFTTTSQLKPGSGDDYREYTCQTKHKSLSAHMPMSTTVQLVVLCKSPDNFNASHIPNPKFRSKLT